MSTMPVEAGEARRQRFLKLALGIVVWVSVFWVGLNLVAGQPLIAMSGAVFGLVDLALLIANRRLGGLLTLGSLWATNTLQITLFTYLLLGPDSLVHYYHLVIGTLPLLLVSLRDHRAGALGAMGVSWSLFLVSELGWLLGSFTDRRRRRSAGSAAGFRTTRCNRRRTP